MLCSLQALPPRLSLIFQDLDAEVPWHIRSDLLDSSAVSEGYLEDSALPQLAAPFTAHGALVCTFMHSFARPGARRPPGSKCPVQCSAARAGSLYAGPRTLKSPSPGSGLKHLPVLLR